MRDSGRAILLVGGLVTLLVFAGGMTMATTYGTLESRAQLAQMSAMMPDVLRGLYGNPIGIDTLGGFIAWHYGAYLALLVGLWSIVALSSTLAGEERRGSLDITLAAPLGRRRLAIEKLGGHVCGLAIVAGMTALATWLAGALGGRFPGDEIAPDRAVAFGLGLAVKGLIAGALAFSLSGLLGRGGAMGVAGIVMVGAYLVQGYRAVVPLFEQLTPLSWFAWTADSQPLVGRPGWATLALVGLVALGLLVAGTLSFERRDILTSAPKALAQWPTRLAGIGGPLRRALGELLPAAVAWGVGLGLYGLVMAVAARAFTRLMLDAPDVVRALQGILPDVDLTTMAGFLQYAFTELGFLLIALAATTAVSVWHGEESGGRLELQLAAPISRVRWTVVGALALWLAIGLTTLDFAVAIGLGIAATGEPAGQPVIGMAVLGLYALALAGIGVAAGGLFGPSWATPTVLVVAVADFLADVIAPILRAPDWVEQLALTAHLGKPIIGVWDMGGVIVCLAVAVGGLAVGAWGMRRRDVQG